MDGCNTDVFVFNSMYDSCKRIIEELLNFLYICGGDAPYHLLNNVRESKLGWFRAYVYLCMGTDHDRLACIFVYRSNINDSQTSTLLESFRCDAFVMTDVDESAPSIGPSCRTRN